MREDGELVSSHDPITGTKWHHLRQMPAAFVAERLAAQREVYVPTHHHSFVKRVGDALEVAVYKAILDAQLPHWGTFANVDQTDDRRFSKQEPPTTYFRRSSKSPVDFHVLANGQMVAIEVKNIREWLYIDSDEVRALLQKATDLDMIPCLVARRIPYITKRTLEDCGVLAHETYNQRYPRADAELATKAAHKDLLGYHDIRLGNDPDARMQRFFRELLPALAPAARIKFDAVKNLLAIYGRRSIPYSDFYTELQIQLGRWERPKPKNKRENDDSSETVFSIDDLW